MPQRAPARAQQSSPAEILSSLNLGYNGYTDPTLCNPRQWSAATNVFSGAFGFVQRSRFANIINGTLQGAAVNISTITGNTNFNGNFVATVTTSTPHGLAVGQIVTIAGNSVAAYNGTFPVSVVNSPTSYFYVLPGNNNLTGNGGTMTPGYVAQGVAYKTLKYFALPGLSNYLLADANGKLFSFDSGSSYSAFQRVNIQIDPTGQGLAAMNGPWSREPLQNILYEVNGTVKQTGRGANALTIEALGLDAPDASPQITISSGTSQTITNIQRTNGVVTVTLAGALTVPGGNGVGQVNVTVTAGDTSFAGTFLLASGNTTATLTWAQFGQNTTLLTPTGTVNTNITKSVGRSYAWAWENANKNHVGAPSPATQFVLYNGQNALIFLFEQGTISWPSTPGGPTVVTGVGTAFTTAWIGKYLWQNSIGNGNALGRITAVASATSMTVTGTNNAASGSSFMIYDPQATHVRLYATADGGATYFRVQRNVFNPIVSAPIGAGLEFFDNANSEPPNFPFTTEVSQLYNVPPPVGAFVKEYQARLLFYGGTIPGQTFFFSNIESTTAGLAQESVAPLNQITLPIQNANISGMADLPGSLIIWSDKHDMFRLTGLLSDNTPLGLGQANTAVGLGTQIVALPYSLGCANPFAVVVTPLGAIWVTSNRELWLYTDKYAPRNIGRPIQNILRNILPSQTANIRLSYYHSLDRNWVSIALTNGTTNNVLISLDLDLLASNGQASFFTFDMATNHPAFWIYNVACNSLETIYETGGTVRLLVGSTDLIQDVDYQSGLFGTEISVSGAGFTTHAWGNDSAFMLKRPTWLRFTTNRDPSTLASEVSALASTAVRSANSVLVTTTTAHGLVQGQIVFIGGMANASFNGTFQVATVPSPTTFTYAQQGPNASSGSGVVSYGWSFKALGIDDDFYTFAAPLSLTLTPGVNDSSTLCGNPLLSSGEAFRHSPEAFRIGGVNFVMGRRLQFSVTFPSGVGVNYALRSIQIGFGPSPPR